MLASFVCLVVLLSVLFVIASFSSRPKLIPEDGDNASPEISVSFSSIPDVVCSLEDSQTKPASQSYRQNKHPNLKGPLLTTFLQASSTEGNKDLTFDGLAVFSKLANACQSLIDVGKVRVQVDKIALIGIKEETTTTCSFCDLAIKAQHAGYSMLIFSSSTYELLEKNCSVKTADKLLIPVVYTFNCENATGGGSIIDSQFSTADQTGVHIRVSLVSDDLKTMAIYLEHLYFWFLVGPVITLEWLRRKKILCCVTTTRQIDEVSGDEEMVEAGREHYIQRDLILTNHAETSSIPVRVARIFGRSIRYFAIGFGYVILNLAALPAGISSGGLSFFRFDEQERFRQKTFWDVLLPENTTTVKRGNFNYTETTATTATVASIATAIVASWWSVVRVFSFFMYSAFACKRTWTVSTNPSKLIRSDWFSSNMYLLVLCFVVPYCSLNQNSLFISFYIGKFLYFMLYNVTCTVCNFLFIIILNKHKVVTRYVFYISVCMICAYVESDIVAVFYFILNSQGSLNNLNLTALRTVALGLTLTLSFSSSMHIIRKLMKPQESVFEGLSER